MTGWILDMAIIEEMNGEETAWGSVLTRKS